MGREYYPTDTLPTFPDIVWCLYPLNEDRDNPGNIARSCLVRTSKIAEDEDGVKHGLVTVSYGGDAKLEVPTEFSRDLIISDRKEFGALGLHKQTRFSMNPNDKIEFIWGPEYFVPPKYIVGANIKIGRLDNALVERMKGCLKRRGLL